MKTSRTGFWLFCGLVLVAMVACADTNPNPADGASGGSSLVLGAESPQALAERLQQAARNNDMREFFACLVPEELAGMVEELTFLVGMMVAFSLDEDLDMEEAEAAVAEKMAGLDVVFERYGLPAMSDDEAMEDDSELAGIIGEMEHPTVIELLAELAEVMDGVMRDQGEDDFSSEVLAPFESDLADLMVEGDRATGTFDDMPVEFVRMDGRWFLKEPEG